MYQFSYYDLKVVSRFVPFQSYGLFYHTITNNELWMFLFLIPECIASAICLVFPDNHKKIGPGHQIKTRWTRDAKNNIILTKRVYELRPPVTIDCRTEIVDYIRNGVKKGNRSGHNGRVKRRF